MYFFFFYYFIEGIISILIYFRLVFTSSLSTIEVIESFLAQFSNNTQENLNPFKFKSTWLRDYDYFTLTGDTSGPKRKRYVDQFNDKKNTRARLFIISTKAGGLGINLTGANRVVIFEPSWNPCDDIQCTYRIFR